MSPKLAGGRGSWLDVGIGVLLVAAVVTLGVLAWAVATSPTSGEQAVVSPAATATPAPGLSERLPQAMPSPPASRAT